MKIALFYEDRLGCHQRRCRRQPYVVGAIVVEDGEVKEATWVAAADYRVLRGYTVGTYTRSSPPSSSTSENHLSVTEKSPPP